ncbi:MAG TPA: hypothetical protein VG939_15670 [Caulobacteraceae bacterium]|nr:hypothetical protein [Caulobacteraceae bacterium]
MKVSAPWRLFRRMQDSAVAVASLVYAFAVVHAWRVLPGTGPLKVRWALVYPFMAFALSLAAILVIPMLRRALSRHVWISFRTGFGQSVISVLAGVGVLFAVAGLVFWNTWTASHGSGQFPAPVFAGYAAGIGLLLAQALITRRLERDPVLRSQIEEK